MYIWCTFDTYIIWQYKLMNNEPGLVTAILLFSVRLHLREFYDLALTPKSAASQEFLGLDGNYFEAMSWTSLDTCSVVTPHTFLRVAVCFNLQCFKIWSLKPAYQSTHQRSRNLEFIKQKTHGFCIVGSRQAHGMQGDCTPAWSDVHYGSAQCTPPPHRLF